MQQLANIKHEQLRVLFDYNTETGVIRHKTKGRICTSKAKRGYLQMYVPKGGVCAAHRVIWFWMTGAWPTHHIDHINGDPTDNRWTNLREATNQQNHFNVRRRMKRDRPIGVHRNPSTRKHRARITFNGKPIHLGYFDTIEEARAAYEKKARELFGEFASF